jgi:hypothetical protein
MTSTVTCGYTGAAWELNSAGQNACQVYAALAGQCNSAFTIGDVTATSPPYMPQNNACTCNLVAYNLQAACGWCQSTIQTNWWLDEAQWAGNCTTSAFDATGIPSSVTTSSINIPAWARLTPTGPSWDPSQASAAAVVVTGAVNTNTVGGVNTAFPSESLNGFSFSYNPYTNTIDTNPYYWNAYYSTGVAAYAVVLGVMFGLYGLLGITVGVFYFIRQKRRRAWYGPMAQYYRQSGVGGYQGNYASGGGGGGGVGQPYQPPYQTPYKAEVSGAPLLYNNEPNAPRSPPTTHTSLYTGGSSPGPGAYNAAYQPPPPASGTNPFNTPYPTPGDQPYQPPPTNSMYGAPPPGAGGASGYKGHAEVY